MASHPLLQRFSPSQPPGLNVGAGCFTSPGLIDAFDCIHIRGFTRWHKKNDTNMFNLFWKQLDSWDDFKQKDRSYRIITRKALEVKTRCLKRLPSYKKYDRINLGCPPFQ